MFTDREKKVGYNINDNRLRSTILEEITDLRKMEPPPKGFSSLYRRYVAPKSCKIYSSSASYIEARTWSDLAFAVRNSTKHSVMDEMVNIVHKDRYNNSRLQPHIVRLVVYDKLEDLPRLLVGALPPILSSSSAPPIRIIPRAPWGLAQPLDANSVIPNTIEVETAERAVDVDLDLEDQIEDVVEQAIPFSIEGSLLPEQPDIPEPTEDEHRNATIIQLTYRQYSSRKTRRRAVTQLAVSRDKWFSACLAMDTIKPGRYQKMILGPLPHILVFLDLLYTGTQESKNNTKKRTRITLKSEELDLLDKQLTQTMYVPLSVNKTN